ncbi:MAG TPA: VOC family protein [Acidimicrobiales bacterium]|nr:VOC family protein [Acidimicrobiales bacterium]
MPITGVHALVYSPAADELREVLSRVIGWPHVDAGDGWRIFALPPAELGVHPGEPHHELSFICDDVEATVAELRAKGLSFRDAPEDRGWGVAVTMVLPGDVDVLLYEPRHPTAHDTARGARPSGS